MRVHTEDTVCLGCERKLNTAHPLLRWWFRRVKARHDIKGGMRVHVAWAYRGAEEQEIEFLAERSRARFPNSPHNKEDSEHRPCSRALDIFLVDADGVGRWPRKWYAKLEDEIHALDEPIFWGGHIEIRKDQWDDNHFQLLQEEELEKWKARQPRIGGSNAASGSAK